jgi:hypothetical protein
MMEQVQVQAALVQAVVLDQVVAPVLAVVLVLAVAPVPVVVQVLAADLDLVLVVETRPVV